VPALLETGVTPRVTVHPHAWEERISCPQNAPPRSIGIPWSHELLDAKHITWQSIGIAQALAPGVWSTGSIPNFMGLPVSRYFQRKRGDYWRSDRFPDEQSLVLTTEWGLVIITGCCHAGVINTMLSAQLVTGIPQIYAMIGGLHLHNWEDQNVVELAHDLERFHIQHLWVNHCTGQRAVEILREEIGEGVTWAGTGTRIELPALFTGEK
jgi:7,8-dihydropterin-6-yl-methyl-4-(beta-D-ribofuranosyl)aminobenzene 5'-phosphate synthase